MPDYDKPNNPGISDPQKLSLIYIIGRGHSGSTLLDVLLGSHPNITGLGELKWLSDKKKRKGKSRVEGCACGASSISDCPFWIKVDRKLQATHSLRLEELDLRSNDLDTFRSHNLAIFRTIHELTGSSFLVDSSKSADRLRQIRGIEAEVDIFPVYIVRTPCGVVFSHVKRGRGLKHWARKYRSGSKEIHRTLDPGRFHVVEYEKFAGDPGKVLEDLARYLGLETGFPADFSQPGNQHHIGGNSMRLGSTLDIRPDTQWKRRLSFRQKMIIRWYTRGHGREESRLRRLSRQYRQSIS